MTVEKDKTNFNHFQIFKKMILVIFFPLEIFNGLIGLLKTNLKADFDLFKQETRLFENQK